MIGGQQKLEATGHGSHWRQAAIDSEEGKATEMQMVAPAAMPCKCLNSPAVFFWRSSKSTRAHPPLCGTNAATGACEWAKSFPESSEQPRASRVNWVCYPGPRQILVGNALQRHAGARCASPSKAQPQELSFAALLANRVISRAHDKDRPACTSADREWRGERESAVGVGETWLPASRN